MDNDASNEHVMEMLWKVISEGGTLQELYAIPRDIMDCLYAHAYNFIIMVTRIMPPFFPLSVCL